MVYKCNISADASSSSSLTSSLELQILCFILFTSVDCETIRDFFDDGLEENETTTLNVALMWC